MWKMGACIALSAAMTLTSTGGMLPSDWGIETVYADETQTTAKTFTAEQLEVIWVNAEHKLEDGQWKLSFLICNMKHNRLHIRKCNYLRHFPFHLIILFAKEAKNIRWNHLEKVVLMQLDL